MKQPTTVTGVFTARTDILKSYFITVPIWLLQNLKDQKRMSSVKHEWYDTSLKLNIADFNHTCGSSEILDQDWCKFAKELSEMPHTKKARRGFKQVAITAGVVRLILESGMKPQNAQKTDLCLIYVCNHVAGIQGSSHTCIHSEGCWSCLATNNFI